MGILLLPAGNAEAEITTLAQSSPSVAFPGRSEKLITYVCYITSFSLFPIVFYIVIALLFVGFTEEVEISIILSLLVFLFVINLHLLTLNGKMM